MVHRLTQRFPFPAFFFFQPEWLKQTRTEQPDDMLLFQKREWHSFSLMIGSSSPAATIMHYPQLKSIKFRLSAGCILDFVGNMLLTDESDRSHVAAAEKKRQIRGQSQSHYKNAMNIEVYLGRSFSSSETLKKQLLKTQHFNTAWRLQCNVRK